MSTLFSNLEIGRKSLYASQFALQVTNNNVSNVNTPGYHRQGVLLTPSYTVPTAAGQIGTGVDVKSVISVRDQFIESRLSRGMQNQSREEALYNTLAQVEAVFNVGERGLQEGISRFFNSWSALATNPESTALRHSVVSAAENLASNFQSSGQQLVDIQQNVNKSIIDAVNQINALAKNIASINGQIALTENTGIGASNFRDERGRLVEELSKLVDIHYYESEDGSFNIAVAGGNTLVTAGIDQPLSASATPPAGLVQIYSGYLDITAGIRGGKMAGLLEARDEAIPNYLNELDTLAFGILQNVNTTHAAGFSLQTPPTTGMNFFTPAAAVAGASRTFSVDSAILADVRNISAAQSINPGDNANALAISALANRKVLSGGTETFAEAYGSLQFVIGSDTQTAHMSYDTQSSMLTQMENQRDAVSAVSLDEEAINLIKYQRAYQAAAKFISVIDQLTAELMSIF
jgi:flagellar hook-associated protein 1 FlgK